MTGPIDGSDYNTGSLYVAIGLTQCGNHAVPAPLCGSQIDKQHLILLMMDDGAELSPKPHQIGGRELAFENRILQVVAVSAHGLEDLPQSLVVGDVVADEKGFTHRGVCSQSEGGSLLLYGTFLGETEEDRAQEMSLSCAARDLSPSGSLCCHSAKC